MYTWLVECGMVSSGISNPKLKNQPLKFAFFWEAKNLVGAFCTILLYCNAKNQISAIFVFVIFAIFSVNVIVFATDDNKIFVLVMGGHFVASWNNG